MAEQRIDILRDRIAELEAALRSARTVMKRHETSNADGDIYNNYDVIDAILQIDKALAQSAGRAK